MAKREPPMSAAPAYIVYGHRHGVRLLTRLLAVGLLLAAILIVVFGIFWERGSGSSPTAAAGAHGGASNVVVVKTTGAAKGATTTPAAATPPPPPAHRKHKPAKPIPPNAQIPIMVLNSNGIHGAAHRLAAQVQSFGYPITYVGNAQKRGLPDDRAVHEGLRPGRAQARAPPRQRAVRDAARRHHAGAGGSRQARHHPRHVAETSHGPQASLAATTSASVPSKTVSWPAYERARAMLAFQPGSFQQ